MNKHVVKIMTVAFFLLMFVVTSLTTAFAAEYRATHTPWSGYWWPFNSCGLADGTNYFNHPSPLEKYELYTTGRYPDELSNWYRDEYCSADSLSWYGHCGHWSLASALENFEIYPSSIDNIIFRVGDKKGLLTLMHTNDVTVWGDGTKPEQFHYWLLKYIKDEKRAFVADLISGEEIWQYPVYRYAMDSVTKGLIESVTVTVYYPSDIVHPDFMGIKEMSDHYTYNLFLTDQGEIIGGEWTGNSIGEHPERMYAPISQGTKAPMLDYETVQAIARSKDDFLENGAAPVSLSPGTYNLILLDPDIYFLDVEKDSVLSMAFGLIEGGGDGFNVVLSDNDEKVVGEYAVSDGAPAAIKINAENPPYTLRVYQDSYDTPGIYNLQYDSFREFSATVPYIPKNGDWSGFSITNFSEVPLENLEVASYTQAGKALQTLMGPLELAPGEKKLFVFRGLPYRAHELSDVDSVRISSSAFLGNINLVGNGTGVTGFVPGRYKGSHIVLPDTVMEMQINRSMFGGIINESDFAADVALTLYNSAGNALKTIDINLLARQSYGFKSGQSPFSSLPDSGWIDVQAENENAILSGFQYIKKDNGIEVNFAVPATDTIKIVPHIPFAGKWETKLVLINNSDTKASTVLHRVMAGSDTNNDLTLELEPKAREELTMETLFETYPANPYYRSILSVASDQILSGYYSYKSIDYDDNVTIPLLEPNDFSSKLLLPHNTQSGSWWTGVGLFNPGAEKVVIQVKPHGKDGTLMSDLVQNLTLDPGVYQVFNMEKMFNDRVFDITFIRFETKDSSKVIGGFYLFGNKEEGMCGANLQSIME